MSTFQVRALGPIAESIGCTSAQLAIAWCVKNPNVSTVLFGATSVDQVLENLRSLFVIALMMLLASG
jgi:aryl-alcohol dehydrogenase-like predicted oxidoreductase